MQEDFTQNGLYPGISMRFETCEVRVRLFKCVSPNNWTLDNEGRALPLAGQAEHLTKSINEPILGVRKRVKRFF